MRSEESCVRAECVSKFLTDFPSLRDIWYSDEGVKEIFASRNLTLGEKYFTLSFFRFWQVSCSTCSLPTYQFHPWMCKHSGKPQRDLHTKCGNGPPAFCQEFSRKICSASTRSFIWNSICFDCMTTWDGWPFEKKGVCWNKIDSGLSSGLPSCLSPSHCMQMSSEDPHFQQKDPRGSLVFSISFPYSNA